jgi:hypothetical protein
MRAISSLIDNDLYGWSSRLVAEIAQFKPDGVLLGHTGQRQRCDLPGDSWVLPSFPQPTFAYGSVYPPMPQKARSRCPAIGDCAGRSRTNGNRLVAAWKMGTAR